MNEQRESEPTLVDEQLSERPRPRRRGEIPLAWRPFTMILGVLIIIASPLVGVIPGPGGIFVFALGLAIVLKSSRQSKKWHIYLRRRFHRYEQLTDLGLGRWKKYRARRDARKAAEALADQESN